MTSFQLKNPDFWTRENSSFHLPNLVQIPESIATSIGQVPVEKLHLDYRSLCRKEIYKVTGKAENIPVGSLYL